MRVDAASADDLQQGSSLSDKLYCRAVLVHGIAAHDPMLKAETGESMQKRITIGAYGLPFTRLGRGEGRGAAFFRLTCKIS